MKCPSCHKGNMFLKETKDNLHILECPECRGHWLKSFEYWKWLHKQPGKRPEISQSTYEELEDSKTVKACPECSHNLIPYKVGHGTSFAIERCNHCAGVWFDANEFEIIEAKNLHDEIHYMFSAPWQDAIEREEENSAYMERVKKILGEEEYRIVSKFREFYKENKDKQSAIMAYLQN